MIDPVAELAAALSRSDSPPAPDELERLAAAVGDYVPVAACPDDLLLETGLKLARAMDGRPQAALAAACVRLTFGVIADPACLLAPDLLSPARREIVGRLTSAISAYERAFRDDALVHYYHGGCEYWRRNIERAYARFDQSRRALRSAEDARLDLIGVRAMRPLSEIARLARREVEPTRRLSFGRRAPAPYMVVACADQHYLARYGPRLRDSLAPFEDVGLHIHVATDAPEAIGPLLGEHVNFSHEPEPNVAQPVHYYQAMRFLRAPELLARYRQPLLFVDIDSEFFKSPSELFKLNAGCHVGLHNNRRAYVPWRKFQAGCVYLDASPRGLRYARYLRNLLASLFAPESLENSWIDQAALAHAVEAVTIHCEGVNVVDNRATGWTGLRHD